MTRSSAAERWGTWAGSCRLPALPELKKKTYWLGGGNDDGFHTLDTAAQIGLGDPNSDGFLLRQHVVRAWQQKVMHALLVNPRGCLPTIKQSKMGAWSAPGGVGPAGGGAASGVKSLPKAGGAADFRIGTCGHSDPLVTSCALSLRSMSH